MSSRGVGDWSGLDRIVRERNKMKQGYILFVAVTFAALSE